MADFMTVAEVAALLRVHPVTVRRRIRCGRLPAVRIGRSIRVPAGALDRLDRADGTATPPTRVSVPPPREATPEELARRRALFERARANRDRQPPLGVTTAELLREVRIGQGWPDGRIT
jgi:excisionase family DNA binding protein